MTDVDLWTESFRTDPYPAYARLSRDAPVYRAVGPRGVETWLISGYEPARAALTDPRLSKRTRHAPPWMRELGLVTGDGDREGPVGVNMLNSDPPDHTRLRKLVTAAFTRRRIDGLRPRVQEITDTLIETMAGHTEADLIAALAFPLPVTVICELLGVPTEDRDEFRGWVRNSLTPPFTEEGMALRRRASQDMENYMADLLARTRSRVDPALGLDAQPDLVSALIVAADEHERLSERELLGMMRLLLIAGHETTVNLIGNGMFALLSHPDQMELLRADPALLPQAVEELLRYDGPVERATPRFAVEDVEIAGVTIPKGSLVSVVLAAADHDPGYVADADRLDITRTGQAHLAFGHGIHFCLGASLARVEGQIAIGALLRRFPDLALAHPPEELRRRSGGPLAILRGLETLPLRL